MAHLSAADVLAAVERHLVRHLGEPDGRAAVTFVGADRIEVLRFPAAGGGVRYATLGVSAAPMADPSAFEADPVRGPRAELVLTLPAPDDEVLRPLAMMAATPQVEGLVLAPGGRISTGAELWPGAGADAVRVEAPDAAVLPDLPLPEPASPVAFLPLVLAR
ncbi:hypothetical protein BIV57_13685 [Mangrovactinospora gilvigrisea]|uniref:Suppressor of fused-like domain-containing protein n=1 Tax=Mangrovactinospora gilvigrisea TaxID=1428644 RepID=A0A1J7BTY7_9ACTN|nr:hypothetical protein BIV57_13685 [Mangrovactinospora gilvigrisea]